MSTLARASHVESSPQLIQGATPIDRRFLAFVLVAFSGAFIELAVLGNSVRSTPTALQQAINSATYFPAYFYALLSLYPIKERSRKAMSVLVWHIAFAYLALFSIIWAVAPVKTFLDTAQLGLTVLVALALIVRLDADSFLTCLSRTLVFILGCSLIAVYVFPQYGLMSGSEFSGLIGIPQGVFTHKNRYAEMAALGAVAALAARSLLSRQLFWSLLVLSLAGMVLSDSAAKTMALFTAVIATYGLVLLQRAAHGVMIGWVLLSLAVLLAYFLLPFVLEFGLNLANKDATLTGRTFIWSHSQMLIELRPLLGYGFGGVWSTPLGIPEDFVSYRPPHAHNLYLEIALRLGLLGILFVTAAFLSILRLVTYSLKSGQPIGRFLSMLTFMLLIRSLFEVTLFRDNQLSYVLLMATAGLAALAQSADLPRKSSNI